MADSQLTRPTHGAVSKRKCMHRHFGVRLLFTQCAAGAAGAGGRSIHHYARKDPQCHRVATNRGYSLGLRLVSTYLAPGGMGEGNAHSLHICLRPGPPARP